MPPSPQPSNGPIRLSRPDWRNIARQAQANAARAAADLPRLAGDLSVDSFIQAMVTVGPFDNYRHSSDKAKRIVGQIRAIGGAHAVRTFLRVALERTICLW